MGGWEKGLLLTPLIVFIFSISCISVTQPLKRSWTCSGEKVCGWMNGWMDEWMDV